MVVVQMNNGDWRPADFWNMPYTSRSYSQVIRLRKEMAYTAQQKMKWWTEDKFGIIKIDFDGKANS